MTDFFANLQWRMPMQKTPASRWTSWARSLAVGRRRIYSRHRAAVMELLRPGIPIYRASHRWELKAWSLLPQINLVVRPMFQQLMGKRAARLSRGLAPGTFELRRNFLTGANATIGPTLRSRNTGASGGYERLSRAPHEHYVNAGPSQDLQVFNRSFQEPLNRVFRRLSTTDMQTETHKLITKESVRVARRMVEETRRVERYGQTPMITRQDHTARRIQENTKGIETKLLEQLAELNKATPGVVQNSSQFGQPVGNLTIDQLTEQVMKKIDDQIVAHKERMGRVF